VEDFDQVLLGPHDVTDVFIGRGGFVLQTHVMFMDHAFHAPEKLLVGDRTECFEAINASGVLAAASVQAATLGVITFESARAIVGKTENALLNLWVEDSVGGLPPHFVAPVAWECNCLEEVCGACTMLINGRVRQSCSALVDRLLEQDPGGISPGTRLGNGLISRVAKAPL